jgi:hypothetical protein
MRLPAIRRYRASLESIEDLSAERAFRTAGLAEFIRARFDREILAFMDVVFRVEDISAKIRWMRAIRNSVRATLAALDTRPASAPGRIKIKYYASMLRRCHGYLSGQSAIFCYQNN